MKKLKTVNRIYTLSGEINESSIRAFWDFLQNNMDDACSSLYVLINSHGGDVAVALAWAALLRSLSCKTYTWNIGNVDSAAILVFAAGRYRLCMPHSCFFFHQVAKKINGIMTADELRNIATELDSDCDRMTRFLQEMTGCSATFWRKKMDDHTIVSAEDSVKNGLATKIFDLSADNGNFINGEMPQEN